jgi:hypothetical protein
MVTNYSSKVKLIYLGTLVVEYNEYNVVRTLVLTNQRLSLSLAWLSRMGLDFIAITKIKSSKKYKNQN